MLSHFSFFTNTRCDVIWLLREPRRWTIFAALLLALGMGWTWASRVSDPAAGMGRSPSPRAGFPAPDLSLETLGGQRLALADRRGQVVVVNFWASWCGPCRAEMPALQRLYSDMSGRGLEILAVNSTVQDSQATAQSFADEFGLSFPILLDRDGAATHAYRVQALPSTFVIDRQGVIRSVLYGGPLSEATLRAAIDPLLTEAP